MPSPSELTVIIVAYNASATISDALRSLAAQSVQGFETVVVDSSTDETPELVRREFPWVRLHHLDRKHSPGAARNVGVSMTNATAGGSLIAFLDADCIAAKDWVEQILRQHEADTLIVGGSIDAANPESSTGWASLFCEFTPWLNAGSPRQVLDIPTCCFSMKHEAFERFGPFAAEGYCSDTIFCWKAGDAGHAPLFVPSIRIFHQNPVKLGRILAKMHMHGEQFAKIRSLERNYGAMHAAVRALAGVVLPVFLYLRTALRVAKAPRYRAAFMRASPALFLVLSGWSWGEARGYARAALSQDKPRLNKSRTPERKPHVSS